MWAAICDSHQIWCESQSAIHTQKLATMQPFSTLSFNSKCFEMTHPMVGLEEIMPKGLGQTTISRFKDARQLNPGLAGLDMNVRNTVCMHSLSEARLMIACIAHRRARWWKQDCLSFASKSGNGLNSKDAAEAISPVVACLGRTSSPSQDLDTNGGR